jgi:hypothetical protein
MSYDGFTPKAHLPPSHPFGHDARRPCADRRHINRLHGRISAILFTDVIRITDANFVTVANRDDV